MGFEVAQRPPDELCERYAVPAAGGEVHHRGVETVTRRQPLVLGDEDAMVALHFAPAVELL